MKTNNKELLGWNNFIEGQTIQTPLGNARITKKGRNNLYLKFTRDLKLEEKDFVYLDNFKMKIENIKKRKVKLKWHGQT